MKLTEFREKYPQDNDLSDIDFLIEMHKENYSDMPFSDFTKQVGYDTSPFGNSLIDGLVESVQQGATFGFSDEIQSGAEAGVNKIKSLFTGDKVDMGDEYNRSQRLRNYKLKDFGKKHGPIALASEISGGMSTGGLGAGKVLASQAYKNAGKWGKPALVALLGGTEAGLYGAGTAKPGNRTKQGLTSAAIGAAVAPVAGHLGNKISERMFRRKVDNVISKHVPDTKDLSNAARSLYDKIDKLGVVLSKDVVNDMIVRIKKHERDFGYHPKIQTKIAAVDEEISKLATKNPTLKDIDLVRRIVSQVGKSTDPSESKLASLIVDDIDHVLEKLRPNQVMKGNAIAAAPLYKQARNLWRRLKKAEMIEEAMYKSRLQRSGFENGLRNQFRSILNNPKKRKAFDPLEQKQMEKIVQGGPVGNILRLIGKFGFGEGQATNALGASIAAGGGAYVGGAPGAMITPTIATGIRKIAQLATERKANNLYNLVKAGVSNKELVEQYIKNVPKAKQNAEELSRLLLSTGNNLSKINPRIIKGNGSNLLKKALIIAASSQTAAKTNT